MRPLLSMLAALALLIAAPAAGWADHPNPTIFQPQIVGDEAEEARLPPKRQRRKHLRKRQPSLSTWRSTTRPCSTIPKRPKKTTGRRVFAALDETTQQYLIDLKFMIDNLWILIAAFLVFIMHLGFATLEIRSDPEQEHRQHPVQERLHHRHWSADLCDLRLQPDVPRLHGGVFGFAGWGISDW